jgi:formate hydrogenlyase subunit 4
LYRSAQLPVGEFVSLAKQAGLRTVINLRGENVGSDWYDAQYRAAREIGVGFINFRMSASRELTVEQMAELAMMYCSVVAETTHLLAVLETIRLMAVLEQTLSHILAVLAQYRLTYQK